MLELLPAMTAACPGIGSNGAVVAAAWARLRASVERMRVCRKADLQCNVWTPLFLFIEDLVRTLGGPPLSVLHSERDGRVTAEVDACLYVAGEPRVAVTCHTHVEYMRLVDVLEEMATKEWLDWSAPLTVADGTRGLMYQVALPLLHSSSALISMPRCTP
jgi:hypothetical protein